MNADADTPITRERRLQNALLDTVWYLTRIHALMTADNGLGAERNAVLSVLRVARAALRYDPDPVPEQAEKESTPTVQADLDPDKARELAEACRLLLALEDADAPAEDTRWKSARKTIRALVNPEPEPDPPNGRIVVIVDGGCVQDVVKTNVPDALEVFVHDYDFCYYGDVAVDIHTDADGERYKRLRFN